MNLPLTLRRTPAGRTSLRLVDDVTGTVDLRILADAVELRDRRPRPVVARERAATGVVMA